MTHAHSKVTAQGQISIPAEFRRKLGVGPGSVLEWEERDGFIVVRKAGRYTSEDVHKTLFGNQRPPQPPLNTQEAIRQHIRRKHARR